MAAHALQSARSYAMNSHKSAIGSTMKRDASSQNMRVAVDCLEIT
jgi:hypothetical protein